MLSSIFNDRRVKNKTENETKVLFEKRFEMFEFCFTPFQDTERVFVEDNHLKFDAEELDKNFRLDDKHRSFVNVY